MKIATVLAATVALSLTAGASAQQSGSTGISPTTTGAPSAVPPAQTSKTVRPMRSQPIKAKSAHRRTMKKR